MTGPHAGHDALAAELRALAVVALDRLDPLVARLHAGGPAGPGGPPGPGERPCTACPVCAALAAARGEHPEAAARVAGHAAGLLAALRDVLAADRSGDGPDGAPDPGPMVPERPVQHIPVDRDPARGGGPC